jgi:iron complex transport system ATP-binding protein
VITVGTIERVFGIRCGVIDDPESLTPMVIPLARPAS